MASRSALVSASLLALTILLHAAPRAHDQAQFRASVDLMTIDFSATAGRELVRDLRADDLALTVDGKPREIRQLQFIGMDAVAAATMADRPPVPAYWTNDVKETGRSVFLYVNDSQIAPGHEMQARGAAVSLIDRLWPADRVAVITSSRVLVDLTTDHVRARLAVAGVTAHSRTAIRQAGRALVWLREFLDSIAKFDGPKTVVVIAEGDPDHPDTDPRDIKDVATAAFAARAQLYIVRPVSFAGDVTDTTPNSNQAFFDGGFEALANAASAAAGEWFEPSGRAENVFAKIEQESASRYLLGFEPTANELNGKLHDIRVESRRAGVTIRARPQFLIPKPEPSAAARPATALDVVNRPAVRRELPLRGAAYLAEPVVKGNVTVGVVVETGEDAAALSSMAFAVIDATTGKAREVWRVPPEQVAAGRAHTVVTVPPGAYRIRAAAVASDGRPGSVEFDITTPAASMPANLATSDLMIGQGLADGGFEPRLTFRRQAAATTYLVIRGGAPRPSALSVTFELARTRSSPALLTVTGIISPTTDANEFTARGAMPIGSLPPGDYVVRARVALDGVEGVTTARAMRKD